MNAEEPRIFLCSREDQKGMVYPGSIIDLCGTCQAEVWLSPASQQARRPEDTILCLLCAITTGALQEHELAVLPQSLMEVKLWLESRN